MENIPVLPESQWKTSEKKLILWVLGGIGILALLFFVVLPKFKKHFVSIPIPQTAGMNASAEFQFTLSPDNRWILYFEQKYPYYDQYNLIAFDTENNKKFTIDTSDVPTVGLQMQIENDCWSKDSHYCVLPVGRSSNDPKILEREKAVSAPVQSTWLAGNQLAESQFAENGGVVGYINNAPDIIIDFTGSTPVLKKQYFDYRQVDFTYRNQNIPTQTDRLTFDQISQNGFTCSDCGSPVNKEKDFGGNSHGREYTSPDGRFIAQEISHGSGFVSPPDLYVTDTKNGSKTFIASNVYYDLHFTSDSNGLYYYGCKIGGGCNSETDHLFYVNLSGSQGLSNKFSTSENNIVPAHTEEERAKDLGAIQQKEEDEKIAVLKEHYDLLTEEFKSPQKIIGYSGVRIFTENHRRIIFISYDEANKAWSDAQSLKFDALAKSLIGKKVTITLPSFDEFVKTYDGADKYDEGFFGTTMEIDDANGAVWKGPTPVDPVYKKYIGTVYANVYLNGQLLK